MLAIAWQCLTGRYAATDFSDREKAEWPPHPDRVFQALTAAWGERGEDPAEREALEWLEGLETPSVAAPDPDDFPLAVKTYVPVNDTEASRREIERGIYTDKSIAILPAERTRKDRYFPYTRVGDAILALVWEQANADVHREALDRLCAAVTRIGHSSSLVRCWITEDQVRPTHHPAKTSGLGGLMLRVPDKGRLAALRETHRRAVASGRYIPPPAARQMRYRLSTSDTGLATGAFSNQLIVFKQCGGQRFTLLQTLDLSTAFRALLISTAEAIGPGAKAMVSGHAEDGSVLGSTHLAFLPLAHVGHEYADGHILGMALALPLGLGSEAEENIFATIAAAIDENACLSLKLGRKGVMDLSLLDDRTVAMGLLAETWCRPADTWATVTPIVLDRMAKGGGRDLEAWAAEQIIGACQRQGIPRPTMVELSAAPFLTGSAPCFRRPAPGQFPLLVKKDGNSNWLFHARLLFPVPLRGPLVLGAGRYRGYGLCKPQPTSSNREGQC